MSSFTDTVEREKQVDFVNYYTAGIQWASPKGNDVDPDNACGLKVAVQATTYEDTDEVPGQERGLRRGRQARRSRSSSSTPRMPPPTPSCSARPTP